MQLRTVITVVLTAGVALHTAHTSLRLEAQQAPAELTGGAVTLSAPGNFRWQRILTPPASAPLAEACVTLDADTFANAAPALRDLRLYQDGIALPYAIEQSFDERALTSGVTPLDDRSFYETSVVAKLQPRLDGGAPGDGIRRNSVTHMPMKPGDVDVARRFYSSFFLRAHVPVERIRIDPAPSQEETIAISATIPGEHTPWPSEAAQSSIGPAHPALPYTIGANLQQDVQVNIGVARASVPLRSVILEMRRRSLCYQPRSASPLVLYLGGGNTMPAESYSFARTFQSARDRASATLGPLLPNPLFHPSISGRFYLTRNLRWTVAILALVALVFFNTQRLLRRFVTRGSATANNGVTL